MSVIGKHILLTGALGSLGQAQAIHLARLGAHVTLVDLPSMADGGETLAKSLTGARYLGIDLDDLEKARAEVQKLCDVSPVDVLINNAAAIINRPFEQFSLQEYERQIRINSSAPFALAQAVTPGMRNRRGGKIINFCSLTLNGQWDGYVPYVASKGALLGLTKTLARELGPFNICVNAISPGAVVSQAEERVFADRLAQYQQWILDHQCLKRRIEPAHVAELVAFLASDSSNLITGQNIGIDGGW